MAKKPAAVAKKVAQPPRPRAEEARRPRAPAPVAAKRVANERPATVPAPAAALRETPLPAVKRAVGGVRPRRNEAVSSFEGSGRSPALPKRVGTAGQQPGVTPPLEGGVGTASLTRAKRPGTATPPLGQQVGSIAPSLAKQVSPLSALRGQQVGSTAPSLAQQVGPLSALRGQRVGSTAPSLAQQVGATSPLLGQRVGSTAPSLAQQVGAPSPLLGQRGGTALSRGVFGPGAVGAMPPKALTGIGPQSATATVGSPVAKGLGALFPATGRVNTLLRPGGLFGGKDLGPPGGNRVTVSTGTIGQASLGPASATVRTANPFSWLGDMGNAVTQGVGDLLGVAGNVASNTLGFVRDTVFRPFDAVRDRVVAPVENAVANEVRRLNSPGDTLSLSGSLDVKVGLKAGIDGEVEVERTSDGYQLSAEVTGDVGVGLVGSASVSGGGRVEMEFQTPEEVARAAVILGEGPAAITSGGEDQAFLVEHLSAMEVNVGAEAEAGLGARLGPANAELSASLGATTSYRVEFERGRPSNLVRSIEIEGSGGASIASGLRGNSGINIGGEVTGSASLETSIPIDGSQVNPQDMLAFVASPASAAFAGPAQTTFSVEGAVDAGPEGRFFTAEVSGLRGEQVQTLSRNLAEGRFDNAFEGVDVEARFTTGSFTDRETGVGARLGVLDFEVNARHRDVTAEGASGSGGTTVSLGGRSRNGSEGSDGSNGAGDARGPGTSEADPRATAPGAEGPQAPGASPDPDRRPGPVGAAPGATGAESRPGPVGAAPGAPGAEPRPGPVGAAPGAPGAEPRPGPSTTGAPAPRGGVAPRGPRTTAPGAESSARAPRNTAENRPVPPEYRVNPATGRLVPVPEARRPDPSAAPRPEFGTDDTGRPPVPVVRNPELAGRTTHVRYDEGRVRIEAGPDATAEDIQAHMETARVLQRYEGAMGQVRQLVDRVRQAITGMPGYGSQGFESRLEVRKLSGILQDLETTQAGLQQTLSQAAGASTPATAEQLRDLERQIASVESQLRTHAAQVDSLTAGRGYVAREDDLAAERLPPGVAPWVSDILPPHIRPGDVVVRDGGLPADLAPNTAYWDGQTLQVTNSQREVESVVNPQRLGGLPEGVPPWVARALPPNINPADVRSESSKVTNGSGLNGALNTPAPDTAYWVDGRYLYVTDSRGRVMSVEGDLALAPDPVRSPSAQRRGSGEYLYDENGQRTPVRVGSSQRKYTHDEGGHLLGAQFGGPPEFLNYVPQTRYQNGSVTQLPGDPRRRPESSSAPTESLRNWHELEMDLAEHLRAGDSVRVRITPQFLSDATNRPDSIRVEGLLTTPDGEVVRGDWRFGNTTRMDRFER
ncbi:DNA/RNA non-specific endonuclease [Myxococcus fulvus]|uniref:DNA/RNA non-specific endonuclease n=1 Tax=Myxococcus fulvus TaxID=33 RepID=UPI0009448B41|nr:DNA/RNA non-specific endonuclease [Myxococcus fulvus]